MPISQIARDTKNGWYFLTPTVERWYYLFDRHNRWQILADSIAYCQQHKGLRLYGYVFMLNHLHMIVESPDVIGFLRDFKRHTSTRLKENLKEAELNVLQLFLDEDGVYRFWKPDNKPKRIEREKFFLEKLNYIHNNPVRKGYVERPEFWKWSSANPHSPIKVDSVWENAD